MMTTINPSTDSVAILTQNAVGGVLTDCPAAQDATPRMARESAPASLPDLVIAARRSSRLEDFIWLILAGAAGVLLVLSPAF